MQSPRRFLPSLQLLSAFEAAARTGSVTAAARELSLTQSAVSRQIKALEEQLGVELFHRERQTIRLTAGGNIYAREIRDALRMISTASLTLKANPFGGTLNLAILPTFGTRWLAPRLPGFLNQHPGITINLVTKLSYFDFRLEPVDAAIHFGLADWQGAEMSLLRSETVVPACSPGLRDTYRFESAHDVRDAPLLHLTTRPDAWERWLRANGAEADQVRGMLFDQFATAAQAAMAGLGVALLPEFLIQEELASGRLVKAIDRPMQSAEAYYLVWPNERGSHPPLQAFRDWILAETAPDRS
ncbi:LysR family transcriptional regulator [Allorhizobium taibaishanense]|uniref:HTH-type transcriptional regulator TtuA n=1 Tax=Allorhizobium taibaishanense TaxID=887144 RepID=A0A1Q9A6A9_9HYPH|nr:LysR family transcriptional regulator [Allorhizobium taibaishanense]MBB4008761.1 LysR family glycine cleavage system transcriptional activator [Allorhizobium taibaishanense]OLP50115.1 LysR family transcriptional regulator [Allorhizobium taibaishanense]